MESMEDSFSFQQRNVLELMQAHVQSINEAGKALDEKAQQNIAISSIIVAILGAFNIGQSGCNQSNSGQIQLSLANEPLFLSIFLVYALIFIVSFLVKWPRTFATVPMKPTWDETQEWLGLDLDKYYDKLVASYTDIVEKNSKIVELKAWVVRLATFLIFVDVLLIFVAALSS